MNAEVIRRQYLDAMGVTTWASRYRLPHALETPACEWEQATPSPATPSQRLHALLEDAQQAEEQRHARLGDAHARAAADGHEAAPQALRTLLTDTEADPNASGAGVPAAAQAPAGAVARPDTQDDATPEPMVFTLSACCLNGRWLNLLVGEPDRVEQALLNNLLGVIDGSRSGARDIMTFRWPPMAHGPPPDDPLEEAREGLYAFVSGTAHRHGWQLEKVLWWGASDHPLFDALLNPDKGHSQTLDLPVWQGPPLDALTRGAEAKRQWLAPLLDLARPQAVG